MVKWSRGHQHDVITLPLIIALKFLIHDPCLRPQPCNLIVMPSTPQAKARPTTMSQVLTVECVFPCYAHICIILTRAQLHHSNPSTGYNPGGPPPPAQINYNGYQGVPAADNGGWSEKPAKSGKRKWLVGLGLQPGPGIVADSRFLDNWWCCGSGHHHCCCCCRWSYCVKEQFEQVSFILIRVPRPRLLFRLVWDEEYRR